MKKYCRQAAVRGVKIFFCTVLTLTMVISLLSPELLCAQTVSGSTETEDAQEDASDENYASDELIIVYEEEALSEDDVIDSEDVDEGTTLSDLGVVQQEEIYTDDADQTAVLAQLGEDANLEEVISALEDDPAVDYVQPNYYYSLLTEEDTQETDSSSVISSDASESLQYYLYSSSFTDAWESVRVEGTVTIAVIDTGCDLDHEDLIDTVDAAHAYDVTTGELLSEAESDDDIGHGTYVCGVIAASADNDTGIAGASYNANVLPVKVFDSDSQCTTADLIAAYAYLDTLIESGEVTDLKVINLSLGYYSDGNSDEDQALEEVISEMRSENGVLTICAGGNSSGTDYCYPADFTACVSVTAVDESGANADFSDYNDAKDLSAYGVSIYTTAKDGKYETVSGTSVASPQAAAAAALVWAVNDSLTPDEVVSILQETADEITGNVHDESGSAGILNAAAAVAAAAADTAADSDAAEENETADTAGEDASDEMSSDSASEQTEAEKEDAEDESAAEEPADETDPDTDEDTSASAQIELMMESWRYSGGQILENPDTDGLTLKTLATYSSYSTWKASYGTSYLGITNSSTGKTTKVAVSGAVRIIIDVSKWQGEIDWEKVAASGVTAAIIRCGYGKNMTSYDDAYFLQNVEGALENGIEIGVYLYSYATTASYAKSEAGHVLRLLSEAGLDPGDLDLPVFYDLEDSSMTDLSASKLGTIAETFCDIIQDAGYSVGIYSSKNWWEEYLTDSVFTDSGWYKWVARYPASTSINSSSVSGTDIWQFTSSGTVSGIDGNVDVSFDYLGSGAYEATKPAKVTLKSVTLSDDYSQAVVKWSSVTGATSYQIYRSVDGGSYQKLAEVSASKTSYTDKTTEGNHTYKYKVRGIKQTETTTVTTMTVTDEETGEETTEDVTEVITTTAYGSFSSAVTVTTAPGTVTITSAAATAKGSIKLTWEAVSGIDGYVIYRSVDGGSYTKYKTITDPERVQYTNSSVTTGTVYRYKIKAYKIVNGVKVYSLSWSNAKKLTARPGKVTITSAKKTSAGNIQVKWEKTEGATGYVIYRSKNGGSYKKVATISKGSTVKWTDTSVTAGRVYRYKIKATVTVNGTVLKAASYSAVKKVTAKPATVTIKSVTSTKTASGTVKWKSVSGATGYQVAYRIAGSSKWYYTTVTTNKKTFTSLRNKKYYVKVRAYRTYQGKKYYGSWSTQKKMTVK